MATATVRVIGEVSSDAILRVCFTQIAIKQRTTFISEFTYVTPLDSD